MYQFQREVAHNQLLLLRFSQYVPVQPAKQVQAPLTCSHAAPFSHWHLCWQFWPKKPSGHSGNQKESMRGKKARFVLPDRNRNACFYFDHSVVPCSPLHNDTGQSQGHSCPHCSCSHTGWHSLAPIVQPHKLPQKTHAPLHQIINSQSATVRCSHYGESQSLSEVNGVDLLKQTSLFQLFLALIVCNKLHIVDPLRARNVYVEKPYAGDCNVLARVYGEINA